MRNAFSIAAGASSGSTSRDAKSMFTKMLTLISPSVSVTGSISTKKRLTAGSRQSSTARSRPSRPRSQGTGRSSWTTVRDERGDRVDDQLGRLSVDERDEERGARR